MIIQRFNRELTVREGGQNDDRGKNENYKLKQTKTKFRKALQKSYGGYSLSRISIRAKKD